MRALDQAHAHSWDSDPGIRVPSKIQPDSRPPLRCAQLRSAHTTTLFPRSKATKGDIAQRSLSLVLNKHHCWGTYLLVITAELAICCQSAYCAWAAPCQLPFWPAPASAPAIRLFEGLCLQYILRTQRSGVVLHDVSISAPCLALSHWHLGAHIWVPCWRRRQVWLPPDTVYLASNPVSGCHLSLMSCCERAAGPGRHCSRGAVKVCTPYGSACRAGMQLNSFSPLCSILTRES